MRTQGEGKHANSRAILEGFESIAGQKVIPTGAQKAGNPRSIQRNGSDKTDKYHLQVGNLSRSDPPSSS